MKYSPIFLQLVMSCPAKEKNVLVRLQSSEIVCFGVIKKEMEGKTMCLSG